jgi:predicted ATPase
MCASSLLEVPLRGAKSWQLMQTYQSALLTEAYGTLGQAEEGLRIGTETLALVEKTGERFAEAELHRIRGALWLHGGTAHHASQAETHFSHALELARQQHAKWWELRAAVSLSQLWQRQGKGQAARQLLTDTYGWFTEGFEMADLQEARALLAALS